MRRSFLICRERGDYPDMWIVPAFLSYLYVLFLALLPHDQRQRIWLWQTNRRLRAEQRMINRTAPRGWPFFITTKE